MARKPRKKTGAVRSKKTKIDGIEFASSLESYCYTRLKAEGLDFAYEGESFVLLASFKYVGTYLKSTTGKEGMSDYTGKSVRAITYTPDFVSHTHRFIIETKGFVPSNHSFPLRWKLFLLYLNENGMGEYRVFMPSNRKQVEATINTILSTLL